MARIGVLNIAPEVDFACHEYEARNGNLIPNSPTAFCPRSADAVAAGGPVRMDHEGQHADQSEAEGAEWPPEDRARDHGFSIARRAVSALPSQG